MKIAVIDGMGGGVGRSVAEGLKNAAIAAEIVLVGINAAATSNMMRSGISTAATGENAVCYNAGRADIIIAPVGAILPNALCGEISPAIAAAIASSEAVKILIPVQNDKLFIAGLESRPLAANVEAAVRQCAELVNRPEA